MGSEMCIRDSAYSASVICVAAVCSHIERLWGVLGRVVPTASDARYVTFWVVGCKQQVTHITLHSGSCGAISNAHFVTF